MIKQPRDPGYLLRSVSSADFARRLATLKNIRPHLLTDEQVYERLKRALNGYLLNPVEYEGEAVFRVRCNVGNELFEDVGQLWYPPANYVHARGRFNGIAESIFYCADIANAAMIEVQPTTASVLTVLVAGLRDRSRKPRCLHIGLQHVRPHDNFKSFIPGGLREDDDFLKDLERMRIKSRWLKLDELCAEFATRSCARFEETDHYKVTGALGRFLSRGSFNDGLMYPSVATEYRALNLALKPDAADRLFFPAEAWMVHVNPYVGAVPDQLRGERNLRQITILRRSHHISSSGNISWGPALHDESPLAMIRAPNRIESYRSAFG